MGKKMLIRFSDFERKTLKKVSARFGYNVTEYIKLKLFHENEDLIVEETFISPHRDKNNVLLASITLKTFHMVKELMFKSTSASAEEVAEAEHRSLEYARKERSRYGYKRIVAEEEVKS